MSQSATPRNVTSQQELLGFNYKPNQISSPEVLKEQRSEGFQFNYPHYNFILLSYNRTVMNIQNSKQGK